MLPLLSLYWCHGLCTAGMELLDLCSVASACLAVFGRKFWLGEQITWMPWLGTAFAVFMFFSCKSVSVC